MPPLSREPGLGQMAIPEIGRPQFKAEDLQARNSFSKAVTPEYHGLLIDDYNDLTAEQLAVVTPQFLQDSLIGVDRSSTNAVFYKNPLTHEALWVAVTPLEFKQTAGNITTLGKTVVNQVAGSRSARKEFGPDRAAAARGGIHAVERELGKLETYRDKSLAPQLVKVNWLQHSANNPGYAWKDGLSVRQYMGEVRDLVFRDMFQAMSIAGDWSPEKTEGVAKVVEYRLFFDRKDNNHIKNWRKMLRLGKVYLGYKQAIYSDKIEKAKKYIQTNAE